MEGVAAHDPGWVGALARWRAGWPAAGKGGFRYVRCHKYLGPGSRAQRPTHPRRMGRSGLEQEANEQGRAHGLLAHRPAAPHTHRHAPNISLSCWVTCLSAPALT